MAGSLLDAAEKLLAKGFLAMFSILLCFLGIHPTTISDSFRRAATFSEKILDEMSTPVDINNDEELIKLAATSLNSKVFVILSAFVGYPKPVFVNTFMRTWVLRFGTFGLYRYFWLFFINQD